MKSGEPLYLNEEQVKRHLRMADLIPAMEKALIDFSSGKVTQPVRSVINVDPPGGFQAEQCPTVVEQVEFDVPAAEFEQLMQVILGVR